MSNDIYREDLDYISRSSLPWERLDHRTVLITGATGLIGGLLADTVIYRNEHFGADIRLLLLSRNQERMKERFRDYLDRTYFEYVCQDVSAPFEQIKHADYIIHAASKGDPQSFLNDPVGIMNANYIGTLNVLRLAKKCGAERALLISTGEVYGLVDQVRDTGITESESGYIDVFNPRNCYASSKRAAENLCACFAEQYDVNVGVARLCHTYGGRIMPDENRVVFQFMRNAIAGQDIIMKSEGRQRRSYCYAADAVKGIFYILLNGQNREIYNVANRESVVTIRELAEIVAQNEGRKVVVHSQSRLEQKGNSGIMDAVLDATKLEGLGYHAGYGIQEGIKRAISLLKSR